MITVLGGVIGSQPKLARETPNWPSRKSPTAEAGLSGWKLGTWITADMAQSRRSSAKCCSLVDNFRYRNADWLKQAGSWMNAELKSRRGRRSVNVKKEAGASNRGGNSLWLMILPKGRQTVSATQTFGHQKLTKCMVPLVTPPTRSWQILMREKLGGRRRGDVSSSWITHGSTLWVAINSVILFESRQTNSTSHINTEEELMTRVGPQDWRMKSCHWSGSTPSKIIRDQSVGWSASIHVKDWDPVTRAEAYRRWERRPASTRRWIYSHGPLVEPRCGVLLLLDGGKE